MTLCLTIYHIPSVGVNMYAITRMKMIRIALFLLMGIL